MVMRKVQILAIFLIAALLAGASAAAEPTTPVPGPGFDWKSLIDTDTSGDHVVGEEMCARPR